ncbi:MAG: TraV family lipoprotein [Rhodospirillaceae bacterium]|nr:TraV family lipoprotein [Rhodospirillaceae bacterium]MYB14184.1 TraV family lipoprotein [Rhodospirillaceae bacterium]MYI48157.1 TraV family lipoprotein [Rhodospirillaceae bacterium]
MTTMTTRAPRRLALPAAIATLLLAGCSSGHIGDSWQCPLATGGACDSVAAADPAVPDRQAAGSTVLREPLWRQRAGTPEVLAPEPCESDCSGGFDPFGWLMRLFRAEARESETGTADGAAQKLEPAAGETVAAPSTARIGEPQPGEPGTAALPAGPASSIDDLDGDSLRRDDLRTGEVVARIWIAPFVDANGVYREAAHVRVVLEPAGWRLP